MKNVHGVLLLLTVVQGACVVGGEAEDDSEDPAFDAVDEDIGLDEDGEAALSGLTDGVNGHACKHSPFNCKFRVEGGNRVQTNDGGLKWAVNDSPIVDANGTAIYTNTLDHLLFNYGQKRSINGTTYVLAMSTSNSSAGWIPLSAVKGGSSLGQKIGGVEAKDPGGALMACYQVRNSHDASIAKLSVAQNYEAGTTPPEADDYMAIPRKNGKRYANLVFNAPGDGLGGPAIDILEAGTKFQRVSVPTSSGRPSLEVKLYDANRRDTGKRMTFIYGYINTLGTRRFGWMALDALTPVTSGTCKSVGW